MAEALCRQCLLGRILDEGKYRRKNIKETLRGTGTGETGAAHRNILEMATSELVTAPHRSAFRFYGIRLGEIENINRQRMSNVREYTIHGLALRVEAESVPLLAGLERALKSFEISGQLGLEDGFVHRISYGDPEECQTSTSGLRKSWQGRSPTGWKQFSTPARRPGPQILLAGRRWL